MVFELQELSDISNSFIDLENVKKELSSNPFGKYLILKENNEIIGYLYFSDIYERAEINQFEIIESSRNCGKGNFLLKEFIKRIKKDITLEVREDNLCALRLYKKNGFIIKAVRKGYYNGIDGFLMERKYINKR